MASPLIHPFLLDRLGSFFSATCTVQTNTPAQDAYGQPIAAWANLAGHVDIPCGIYPTKTQQEVKRADGTITVATHRANLQGVFASITTAMRLVSEGLNYDIVGVVTDSQRVITSLLLERVA